MTILQQIITIGLWSSQNHADTFPLPFIVFPEEKSRPKAVRYLGGKLPYAVIGLLVAIVSKTRRPAPLTVCRKPLRSFCGPTSQVEKNMLLSIARGTILYMLLVQMVF